MNVSSYMYISQDGPEDKTSTTQSTERSTKTTEALYDQV